MPADRSPADPRPGDELVIDGGASVQFAAGRGFRFRVTTVDKRWTYDGWVWLTGYVVAADGDARERREIFVERDGLRWAPRPRRHH